MIKKISVSCLGSRERYGLPVALHHAGLLDRLYTDIYVPESVSSFAKCRGFPRAVRAMLDRNHRELPFSKVHSQYLLGLQFRTQVRRAKTLFERQELLLRFGSAFSSNVSQAIRQVDGHVAFTGGALEVSRICKERGIRVILDQVDAGLYDWELVAKEVANNPGWESSRPDTRWSPRFEDRVRSELDIADEIVVNSEYSKSALAYWGVSKTIHVLPIASTIPRAERQQINFGKLRVLFLGLLSLRKGVHIAVSAVDRLVRRGLDIELILAGESILVPERIKDFKGCTYIGPIPGNAVPSLIDSCDVMLFPTFSDGFGMVQVEAISRGIPVIATKNAGSVIEDRVSGFIVDVGSVDEVAWRLEQYHKDRDLLRDHGNAAFERSAMFASKPYREMVRERFG